MVPRRHNYCAAFQILRFQRWFFEPPASTHRFLLLSTSHDAVCFLLTWGRGIWTCGPPAGTWCWDEGRKRAWRLYTEGLSCHTCLPFLSLVCGGRLFVFSPHIFDYCALLISSLSSEMRVCAGSMGNLFSYLCWHFQETCIVAWDPRPVWGAVILRYTGRWTGGADVPGMYASGCCALSYCRFGI